MTRTEAYDKIDRYLRNNLNDDDYADYSSALELVLSSLIPLENSQEAQDVIDVVMKDYNYPSNPYNCARVGWRAARTYNKG